jgi:hypothetical protein
MTIRFRPILLALVLAAGCSPAPPGPVPSAPSAPAKPPPPKEPASSRVPNPPPFTPAP